MACKQERYLPRRVATIEGCLISTVTRATRNMFDTALRALKDPAKSGSRASG
ncbi:MAG: hypothetical protein L0229_13620 [Blastocatellia bacterium]|nr:hypothetical protein [Blastocatellia bacterium]